MKKEDVALDPSFTEPIEGESSFVAYTIRGKPYTFTPSFHVSACCIRF